MDGYGRQVAFEVMLTKAPTNNTLYSCIGVFGR